MHIGTLYSVILFRSFLYFKDNRHFDEIVYKEGWKGPWKYKDIPLEDHLSVPIFRISRLLNKITGLQVTSPDMEGRESAIPISFKLATYLNAASDHLRVPQIYCCEYPKKELKQRPFSLQFIFLQINIYTPAGFIYPHYDVGEINLENIPPEHRITTAMFYVRYELLFINSNLKNISNSFTLPSYKCIIIVIFYYSYQT